MSMLMLREGAGKALSSIAPTVLVVLEAQCHGSQAQGKTQLHGVPFVGQKHPGQSIKNIQVSD